MLPVRKKLTDLLVNFEPGARRSMMRLIGYDFMDSRNFIEVSYDRHHTCDSDLSSKIGGDGIDGGDFYSGPHEVELFNRLPQKLVTVNENKSLISRSTQAGLENVAEDDGLAASGGEGNQSRAVSFLPVTKDSVFRLS